MKQDLHSVPEPLTEIERARLGVLLVLASVATLDMTKTPNGIAWMNYTNLKNFVGGRKQYLCLSFLDDQSPRSSNPSGKEYRNVFLGHAKNVPEALAQLKKEGLITENEKNRTYHITDAGREYLKTAIHERNTEFKEITLPERTAKAPRDLMPGRIKQAMLEKVSRLRVPPEITGDDVALFNNARAGILHMLAVRQVREWRFRVSLSLSKAGEPDRDMRGHKIIRRMLSSDVEGYIVDPAPKWEKGKVIRNPYGCTGKTEEELKPLLLIETDIVQRKAQLAQLRKDVSSLIAENEKQSLNDKTADTKKIAETQEKIAEAQEKIAEAQEKIAEAQKAIALREAELEKGEPGIGHKIAINKKALNNLSERHLIDPLNKPLDRKIINFLGRASEYKGYKITTKGFKEIVPIELFNTTREYMDREKRKRAGIDAASADPISQPKAQADSEDSKARGMISKQEIRELLEWIKRTSSEDRGGSLER